MTNKQIREHKLWNQVRKIRNQRLNQGRVGVPVRSIQDGSAKLMAEARRLA